MSVLQVVCSSFSNSTQVVDKRSPPEIPPPFPLGLPGPLPLMGSGRKPYYAVRVTSFRVCRLLEAVCVRQKLRHLGLRDLSLAKGRHTALALPDDRP